MYDIVSDEITAYTDSHSQKESELLKALRKETVESVPGSRMLSGPVVGAFLRTMVRLTGAKRILEIGTYTGYSALSMAESLTPDAKIITLDIDENVADVAQKYFDKSGFGHQIELRLGDAMESIANLNEPLDLVFIDADKRRYSDYFDATLPLLRQGGVMIFDNVLWSGRVLSPEDEQSKAIDALNKKVTLSKDVDNCLLSVRDGLQLVTKLI